jgi:hypothetical protein
MSYILAVCTLGTFYCGDTLTHFLPAIETDLSRDQDDELTAQFYKVAPYWKSPDEGSSTTLVAALDPALNGELLPCIRFQNSSHDRLTLLIP